MSKYVLSLGVYWTWLSKCFISKRKRKIKYKTAFLFLILKVWHELTQNRAFSMKFTAEIYGPNSPR